MPLTHLNASLVGRGAASVVAALMPKATFQSRWRSLAMVHSSFFARVSASCLSDTTVRVQPRAIALERARAHCASAVA